MVKEIILRVMGLLNEQKVFPIILTGYTSILAAAYLLTPNGPLFLPLILILFILPLLVRLPIIRVILMPKKVVQVESPVVAEIESLIKNSGKKLKIIVLGAERPNVLVTPFGQLFLTLGFIKSFGNNLSEGERKEIKAVIGHETTHFERQNLFKFAADSLVVISIFVITFQFLLVALKFSKLYQVHIFLSFFWLSMYLILFWIFRRNEYRADAGSLLKGNDAGSFIRGLIRVEGKLKEMSLLERINEILSDHPHQSNRIKKIKKLEETMRAGSKAS